MIAGPIVLRLFLCVAAPGLAEAESAYRDGRYAEALDLFAEGLDEPGAPRGAVLYDMGNCAYRLGRLAEALLHYERAALRIPRDPELLFNLRLTRRDLGLADDAAGATLGASVAAFVRSFAPEELLAAACGLETIGLGLLVLFRRRRGARNAAILVLLLAAASGGRLVQVRFFPGPPRGIVLGDEIAVRPEPHADLEPAFRLEAGETVRVEESSGRFVRVSHRKSGTGWTEAAGVGVVD